MLSRYFFSLILIVGLVAGFTQEASAVGQCSTVCRGPNKPCRLRCAIGSFVTTCGQVSTTCVGFATDPFEDNLFSSTSCELSTDAVVAPNELESNDIVATNLVTWIRDHVAFIESLVSHLRPFTV